MESCLTQSRGFPAAVISLIRMHSERTNSTSETHSACFGMLTVYQEPAISASVGGTSPDRGRFVRVCLCSASVTRPLSRTSVSAKCWPGSSSSSAALPIPPLSRDPLGPKLQRRRCLHTPTRRHFHWHLRASWMNLASPLARPLARAIGHKGACHWSGNSTVQRAPGVRSTLKLPSSRCASVLTNPRPDK